MKLYIVPTPIGNLEDITIRALSVLKDVDVILAEDTRQTSKLLKHYEINKKLVAHHQHNEHKTLDRIIESIKSGEKIALVFFADLAEENHSVNPKKSANLFQPVAAPILFAVCVQPCKTKTIAGFLVLSSFLGTCINTFNIPGFLPKFSTSVKGWLNKLLVVSIRMNIRMYLFFITFNNYNNLTF